MGQVPEIPVEVTHIVMVDRCIAEEVRELNNHQSISTEFACCGHGYRRSAFIKVLKVHIDDMKALGYQQKAPRTEPQFFKPKGRYPCNNKDPSKRACYENGKGEM